MYIYIYRDINIYIYIYNIEREERDVVARSPKPLTATSGAHQGALGIWIFRLVQALP